MRHETAERLRTALHKRAMKPVELAERTGIPRSAVSQYLAGKYVPKQDKLYLLSRVLQVDVLWLMGLSDQMNGETKYSRFLGPGRLEEGGESYRGEKEADHGKEILEFTAEDNDMACSGILKGDRITVEKGPVESGRVAAVCENGTMHLRRVYCIEGRMFLKADCPEALPVSYDENRDSLRIIGKAVQCRRDIR
mgnify:CR=1 FL=1